MGGNIIGLKASQKKALERTYHRRVSPRKIVSPELARHLAWISREIGRQVGVLINRRGQIEQTFVGEPKRIYLPDVGRQRVGLGHFRGLRHVHTVLDDSGLHAEDLADLTKLRLDLVCALAVTAGGEPGEVSYAYPMPDAPGGREYRREGARSVHEVILDFEELIRALEEEMARHDRTRDADAREGTVLVGLHQSREAAERSLTELRELAATAGVQVLDTMVQLRRRVDSKYVVGKGKLEEVVLHCLDLGAELVIFDHNLTPAQARAIAAFSDLKVIDRTQLILDIFAQHAKSRDGKLQVELAQLKYNLPRLTDLDAGLSRLTGGIGGQGPGETKLEINRRRARDRIARLTREINLLSKRRELRRAQRQRTAIPVVSIVGYTNAGKSTLLNKLTHSDVDVKDKLFATLDPTSRRLRFPQEHEAIITDTVGFIRDLPPDLIKAFRATLEELETADLLVHVIDVADPAREEKVEAVIATLGELHLDGIPRITVYNKSDLIEPFQARALALKSKGAAISAASGEGVPYLVSLVAHRLWQTEVLSEDDAWAAEAREDIGNGGTPTAAIGVPVSTRRSP
ncbi:GTPase HflX [Myxococcota bacterium]